VRSRKSTAEQHTPADGAKAFHIASDLESKLLNVRKLFSMAMLMVESADDDRIADAFSHIGSHGYDLMLEIDDMRMEIFELTWGYACGPERDQRSAEAA